MIRIGVVDCEKEYVKRMVCYLQKYSSGKWVVSGFTSQQDLINYMGKKMLDIVVGTDQGILANACKGKGEIQLWLKSEECDLEEIEEQVYIAYRFQSALEIGKCIERIIRDYEKNIEEEITWVAMYSPIGRCGKTTLALEITKKGMSGRWVYIGLEDYNSFAASSKDNEYMMDELLYYWKERKGDNILHIINQTEGFIETGSSFLDGKDVTAEDVRWLKKLFIKSKYKGVLFDIGSGVLQSLHIFREFDIVIVPYVKEENALVKKCCFEKLLEQHEMKDEMKRFWFVNMGDQNEISKVKEKLLGGDVV